MNGVYLQIYIYMRGDYLRKDQDLLPRDKPKAKGAFSLVAGPTGLLGADL